MTTIKAEWTSRSILLIGDLKIVGLIPARGSSKGLPGKNIKEFVKKPLIAWSIEEALKSKYIDTVIVNTESKDIADIAKDYGAYVPFLRSKELAKDDSLMIDVINDFQKKLEDDSQSYEIIILLQPTSPLRTAEDIDRSIEFFYKKEAQSVISVSENHNYWWTSTLPDDFSMKDFSKNIINKPRQDLDQAYTLNGSICVLDWEFIRKSRSVFGDNTFAFLTRKESSIDIDDYSDFVYAEFLKKSQLV